MSLIKTHTCKTNQGELPVKGRFAPSPTGRMHAGNIFSALVAWLIAKSQGGKIVLRIEDLDAQRSKQRYIDAVMGDFEALGLFWDEGPFFQHGREEVYENAYKKLEEKGLVYPCFCTRADLHAASESPRTLLCPHPCLVVWRPAAKIPWPSLVWKRH